MAKQKTINVTKKLGLKPMAKNSTLKDWNNRVLVLQKKIASGKYQGHLLDRCHDYINNANRRIRALKGIKQSKSKFNPDQAMLPNFIKQLDMVRIEEMVAERLFEQMRAGIESAAKTSKKKAS